MAHEQKKLSDDPLVRGHETSDADPKVVTISGIFLSFGLVVLGLLASWGVYAYFKSIAPTPGAPPRTFVAPETAVQPPLPRLQANPHVDLIPFVKGQDSVLASFGWAEKDSGYARIPIEEAMKLVVQRGLPVQSNQ